MGGLAPPLLLLTACTTTIDAAHEPGVGTIINPNCLAFCKYEQGRQMPDFLKAAIAADK
jgi:hypothetical protein